MDGKPIGEEINPRKGENEYELLFLNGKRMLENSLTHDKNMDNIGEQAIQNAVSLQGAVNAVVIQMLKESAAQSDAREKRYQGEAGRREDQRIIYQDTAERERIEAQEMYKGGD